MGGNVLSQRHRKAKSVLAIGVTAPFLGLIACAPPESPTSVPSDIPAFSEGEAIAVVQTVLLQSGCDVWFIAQSNWSEEYLGQGKWSVKSTEIPVRGAWIVFENSLSVSIEQGEGLRC